MEKEKLVCDEKTLNYIILYEEKVEKLLKRAIEEYRNDFKKNGFDLKVSVCRHDRKGNLIESPLLKRGYKSYIFWGVEKDGIEVCDEEGYYGGAQELVQIRRVFWKLQALYYPYEKLKETASADAKWMAEELLKQADYWLELLEHQNLQRQSF